MTPTSDDRPTSLPDAARRVLRTPRGRRTLALVSAATTASAVLGAVATDPESLWYRRLDKPSWQPPALAFPIVWTALYASIAATSTSVLTEMEEQGREEDARAYRTALAANLALNTGWSTTFFAAKRLRLAVPVAAALAGSCADLARRAGSVTPAHGATLVPYTAWCSFATVLTAELARRNPR